MIHIPNTHINYQIPKDEYTPYMTGTGNAMKQMGFTYELKMCVSTHHERNNVKSEVDHHTNKTTTYFNCLECSSKCANN